MSTTVLPRVRSAPPPQLAPSPTGAPRARLDSIDLLRGLVMVIMLLDHARFFVFPGGIDPTDLTRTSAPLFLTRWITHFCAPVFVFLAGTGAFLQLARGKDRARLSRFLLTRGLWLVVLEFTLVRLGAYWNLDYTASPSWMQVIWAIGVSMMALAGLLWLPLPAVGAFGVAMMVLHNLLDGVRVAGWKGPGTAAPGLLDTLWIVLYQPHEKLPLFGASGPVALVLYPLVPWIGVMAAGFAFGSVYRMEAERRRRILVRLGLGLVAAFSLLRALNLYGDPFRWEAQSSPLFTVLSFVNTTKYPASLLFLLMTLGPAMLALAWVEGRQPGPLSRALVTFGRVPLFFYLLQWPVAKGMALLLGLAAGREVDYLFSGAFVPKPPGSGFDLWVVYACWMAGIAILYPLCRWFAGVRQRRREWWLGYL